MTAVVERPRTKKLATSVADLRPLPQVNLLPPEVRAARGLKSIQRWLALALVLVVVLCAAGYAYAVMARSDAEDELTGAQERTADLQSQMTQYAAVPVVLAALADAETAEQVGMSTDVEWSTYIGAVATLLPADMKIESFLVTAATPLQAAITPTDPLQGNPVGSIQFTGRAPTLPDSAAWVDTLDAMPGFADTWVSSAAITGDDDSVFYRVTLTVQVTADAYSGRFAAATSDDEGN